MPGIDCRDNLDVYLTLEEALIDEEAPGRSAVIRRGLVWALTSILY